MVMQVFQLLVLAVPDPSAGHCPVSPDRHHWPDSGCGLHTGVAHLSAGAATQWLCLGQEQHPRMVHRRILGPAHVISAERHRDQRIHRR